MERIPNLSSASGQAIFMQSKLHDSSGDEGKESKTRPERKIHLPATGVLTS